MNGRKVLLVLVFVLVFSFPTFASMNAFFDEVNQEHYDMYSQTWKFSGIEDFSNKNVGEILTSKEMNNLIGSNSLKETVSVKQALEDVDLYFRALKYAYSGYEFFGGDEVFLPVRDEMMTWINNHKGRVVVNGLKTLLADKLWFIRDTHFSIHNLHPNDNPENQYYMLYDESIVLSKEDERFYLLLNGDKYFFESCDNSFVQVGRFLNSEGILYYTFIQWAPETKIEEKSQVVFKNADGDIYQLTVNWKKSSSMYPESQHKPDFKEVKVDGIVYIQLRSFSNSYTQELEAFAKSANDCKDAKLIILDVRSNGGGNDGYLHDWYRNFTGKNLEPKRASVAVQTKLANSNPTNNRELRYSENQGSYIKNNIPIIILGDKCSGSSGESSLYKFKSLENTYVIGTNSSGCATFGNVNNYTLPNSGIPITFGKDLLCFYEEMTNIDGMGFEPDIWCDAAHSLDSVLKMLNNYGFLSDKELSDIDSKLSEYFEPTKELTVMYKGKPLQANGGFGSSGDKTLYLTVFKDGQQITDYEYSATDNEKHISKEPDGTLVLNNKIKKGDTKITIKSGNYQITVRWHRQ